MDLYPERFFTLRRYECLNRYCSAASHSTPTCPTGHPITITDEDMRAHLRWKQMVLEGDFKLTRTPSYMRERAEKRAELASQRPRPGYGWLLVVVPAALLLAVVMGALMLYL